MTKIYVQKGSMLEKCRIGRHCRWPVYNLAFWPERATVHLMRPLGPDWGAYTSASLPVFLRPLCQLRSIK